MIVMGVTGHGPTADPLPGVGPWLVDPRIDGLSDQAHAGSGFPLVGRLVVALLVGMRLGVSGVLAPPGQDVEDGLGLHGGQSPARRPVDHGDVVLDLVRLDGGRTDPPACHRRRLGIAAGVRVGLCRLPAERVPCADHDAPPEWRNRSTSSCCRSHCGSPSAMAARTLRCWKNEARGTSRPSRMPAISAAHSSCRRSPALTPAAATMPGMSTSSPWRRRGRGVRTWPWVDGPYGGEVTTRAMRPWRSGGISAGRCRESPWTTSPVPLAPWAVARPMLSAANRAHWASYSTPMPCRPRCIASTPVVKMPAIGSHTHSPTW